jgi:heptosyltransferase-2
MKTLILKLGATGDVVRTTSLLRRLNGHVTWLTTAGNRTILPKPEEFGASLRVVTWDDRSTIEGDAYDLVINLEDDSNTASWLTSIRVGQLFGALLKDDGQMSYTEDAKCWFDMSLVSVYGRDKANALKLQNRRSYQELVFSGLGWTFADEEYLLPNTAPSELRGDVAIASESGPVWPMKKWAHYDRLKHDLESEGLTVNFLPKRPTLLEHLADVRGHRCLVSGDSLPMHLALGSGIPGVALFNCTSPWEIHDYGRLTKLVSPLLSEFFYRRDFDTRATAAISFEDVYRSTRKALGLLRSAGI